MIDVEAVMEKLIEISKNKSDILNEVYSLTVEQSKVIAREDIEGLNDLIDKKQVEQKTEGKTWFVYAALSAVFAALTSILAKVGIDGVNSNLATAIRTVVVVVMSWGMVFLTNAQGGIMDISRRSWLLQYMGKK